MTIGSLADLVAIDGMPSQPSLQRFIASRPDFPLIERGRYGRPYRLDLDEAVAFVRAHWSDGRLEHNRRTKREQAAPQLPLFDQPEEHR